MAAKIQHVLEMQAGQIGRTVVYALSSQVDNGDVWVSPHGTGAIRADDEGDARGDYAIDFQRTRNESSQVASGQYAVISGGRSNELSGWNSVISGGSHNKITINNCSIAGGSNNLITAYYGSIGGGGSNEISGSFSTISGGGENEATANFSTISGGNENEATANFSTVVGGRNNVAGGEDSVAAGRRAKANANGTFVFADSTDADFAVAAANQVAFRAAGGLRLVDGNEAANRILACDASGVGHWTDLDAVGGLENIVEDTSPQLGGNLDVNSFSIVSTNNGNIAITPNGTGDLVLDGLNWPQADGSADQVLKTDGAGQLSWVDQDTGLENVVEDLTPQLGGDLDVNGQSIVSVSNGNIAITPDGTGHIALDGLNWPQADGSADQFLKTDGAGQLSWSTVTTDGLENVVEDLTPQLGGDLDVNGQSIVSVSDGDICISPDGTGAIRSIGGDPRGSYAIDWQRIRTADEQCARGLYSIIAGGEQSRIAPEGTASVISGGRLHVITESWATIAGGSENTNSCLGGVVSGGSQNELITGSHAIIAGGQYNKLEAQGAGGNTYGAVIGGGISNTLLDGQKSTISGGDDNLIENDNFATIGGGGSNTVTSVVSNNGEGGTVAGGYNNQVAVDSRGGSVGGGFNNDCGGRYGVIAGGLSNTVVTGPVDLSGKPIESYNTSNAILGGESNTVDGAYSSVLGGHLNEVDGGYSVAAGRRAKANANGIFVFADSTDADFAVTTANQVAFRAAGGLRLVDGNEADGYVLTCDTNGVGTWQPATSTGGLNNVVEDLTPQLGGNLDTNTFCIVTVSDRDLCLAPDGTGAIRTDSGGDARGIKANDFQRIRDTDDQVASGNYSVICGGYGNKASGSIYSTICGGVFNICDAPRAFIGGGYSNTVTSSWGVIAGGDNNSITSGSHHTIGGGVDNSITSTGSYGIIAGGKENLIESTNYGIIGGGEQNVADNGGMVIGGGSK